MKKYLIVFLSILSLSMAVCMDNTYADSKKAEKPPDSLYMKPTEDESASQDASLISGKIVETMNSGGYTYLCIEKDGKKTRGASHRQAQLPPHQFREESLIRAEGDGGGRRLEKLIFHDAILPLKDRARYETFREAEAGRWAQQSRTCGV